MNDIIKEYDMVLDGTITDRDWALRIMKKYIKAYFAGGEYDEEPSWYLINVETLKSNLQRITTDYIVKYVSEGKYYDADAYKILWLLVDNGFLTDDEIYRFYNAARNRWLDDFHVQVMRPFGNNKQ